MEAAALQRPQSGLLCPRRQNLCPRLCSTVQAIGRSAGNVDARYARGARFAAHKGQSHESVTSVLAHRLTLYQTQEGLQGISTPCREIRRQPGRRSTGTNASRLVVVSASASDSVVHAATATPLVLSFGEMLIDFVPTVNGVALADAPAFIPAPGGAPANVAVGVSRLGGQAAFVGKVGDDEFGRMLVRILEANGVDTSGVRLDQGARTALAFVTLRADGEREFMFYRHPSADMLLRPDELNTAQVRSASVVHFGSISLIAEPCRSAHLALLHAAEQAGVILSYDPNLRLPLWPSADSARDGILSIWKRAHVVKVSEDEVMFLTSSQQDPLALCESNGDVVQQADELDVRAMSLVHEGLKLLLVTEGEKGCRYYGRGFRGSVAGFHVETIDTTGAGDAFVAGFLSGLAAEPQILDDEERLREALRFANACGAIATTVRGAIPALPDREAALELLSPMGAYLNVEAI